MKKWLLRMLICPALLGLFCLPIFAVTDNSLTEEVIYVCDGLDYSWQTAQGYVYEVYNTKGELLHITLKERIAQGGFYRTETNDNGVTSLVDINQSEAAKRNQEFKTIYKNLLYTNGIDHYDMSEAVIVDTRSEMDLEMSEIPELETGAELLLAKRIDTAEIKLDAFVDVSNKKVDSIFVTNVVPAEDSGSSGGSGEAGEGTLVTITKVDNGSISVYGLGKLGNNESFDRVVEYDGIAAGDIAICTRNGQKWILSPTTVVDGRILKIQWKDNSYYITIGDVDYMLVDYTNRTTLNNDVWDVNFYVNSRLYIAQDGTCVGFEVISDHAQLTEAILAVDVYEVSDKDGYGKETRTVYVQGIDVNGEEVNYIVGVAREDYSDVDHDGNTGWDTLYDDWIEGLGISYDPAGEDDRLRGTFVSGFYTFDESYDADAAALGIMIPWEASSDYEPGREHVYARKTAFDDEFALTPETLYVPTEQGVAYLKQDTRYIAYNGAGGPLEIRQFEHDISYVFADGEKADLLLGRDRNGNTVVEAMFICTEPEKVTPSVFYPIVVDNVFGGTIRVDKSRAAKGETITITAQSDTGYILESILVDDEVIEGYTFSVSGEHTVSAVFRQVTIDDIVYAVCSYTTEQQDEYGVDFMNHYVQCVDMYGQEVNVLVGMEQSGNVTGVQSELVEPSFYIVAAHEQPDVAKLNIQTLIPMPTAYDADTAPYYIKHCAQDVVLTEDATDITTADGEVVYLTEETQYFSVSGEKAALEITSYQNGVSGTFAEVSLLLTARSGKPYAAVVWLSNDVVANDCTVTVETASNGTVSVDKDGGQQGETVTVTATPKEGYYLRTIRVDGVAIEGNTFTISGNHTVTATFAKLTKFYGSNIDLGSTLDMNFYYAKNYVTTEGCYAKLVRTYTDGREDDVQTLSLDELPLNGAYYQITYDGLAAKEMCDAISVTLYNSAGTAISETYTQSIRSYVMRALDHNSDSVFRTALVDMLNYGAAAQIKFGYSTEDLANNQLTEELQAESTKSVSCENVQLKTEYVHGSNLDLESRILLNFYFTNVTSGMYAEVSYTNHLEETESYRVEYEDFVSNGNTHQICVDMLAIADSNTLVTCTMYNADGSQHASATDSMNSYLARALEADASHAWMEYIAKFSASAYKYLHGN